MYYTPKTDEEIEAERPKLVAGEADFEVLSAALKEKIHDDNKKSQYFEVSLRVWDCNGNQGVVKDFLSSNAVWKIKQFCDATGLEEAYMNPPLQAHQISSGTGKCTIHYEKNKDPKYGDQLRVKSYINPKKETKSDSVNSSSSQQASTLEPFADDDIPF